MPTDAELPPHAHRYADSQNEDARKPKKLADERGMYLLLTPSGGRLWRFKYRLRWQRETARRWATYPDVSLAKAREARDDARKALAAGN